MNTGVFVPKTPPVLSHPRTVPYLPPQPCMAALEFIRSDLPFLGWSELELDRLEV